jgi:WD40 repeat protein
MLRILGRVLIIQLLIVSSTWRAQADEARQPITRQNASQLAQLSRLGRGSVGGAAWSLDGLQFYVAGSEGLWRYNARDWDQPPELIIPRTMSRVVISPDGKTIAYSIGHSIELWDTVNKRVRATLQSHFETIQDIVFSPDSHWLASTAYYHHHEVGARDPEVRIWHVSEGRLYGLYREAAALPGFRFTPNSQNLVYATRSGWIEKLDLTTGQSDVITKIYRGDDPRFYAESHTSTISSKGDRIADGGCPFCQFYVYVYDANTRVKQHLNTPEPEPEMVDSMEFSPDAQLLATGGQHGGISLWNIRSGTRKRLATKNMFSSSSEIQVRFSPDGTRLASVEQAGVVIWDVQTGQIVRRLVHGLEVTALTSFNKQSVYTNIQDNTLELRDVSTGNLRLKLPGCLYCPWLLSPDHSVMALRSKQNITVWDAQTGTLRYLLGGLSQSVFPVLSISEDNRWLFTNGEKPNTLRLWDLSSGKAHFLFTAEFPISEAHLSPDGRQLAAMIRPPEPSESPRLALWNVTDEQPYKIIDRVDGSLQFSEDGVVAAVADSIYDDKLGMGGISLIDAATGASRLRLPVGRWTRFQFSPQGQLLVFGASFSSAPLKPPTLFDIHTGSALFSLPDGANVAVFNADGSLIAVSLNNTIAVVDAATGATLVILPTPRQSIIFMAFSPDDRLLVSASNEGIVSTWGIRQ